MSIQELLSLNYLDMLLVTVPENVRYLSGFTAPGDGRVIVSSKQEALLLTDGRYTVQAKQESRIPYRIIERATQDDVYRELLSGRVGFEAEGLTVAAFEKLRAALRQATLVSTEGRLSKLRLVKQSAELAHIRAAAEVADRAFEHILNYLKPGVSEHDVALELEFYMRRSGAEGSSFDIIVASGPRSAMPHGTASTKEIKYGELVTLDFGARVQGYHSDMTRTLAVGLVDAQLRAIYDAVLEAEETALAQIAPGKPTRELDTVARNVLTQRGFGSYFTHSLGHGVGLAVHEGPTLSQTSKETLKPGMVITIEPGVYIPEVGGCRIEDLVLVTEDGYEVLSKSPKSFTTLG